MTGMTRRQLALTLAAAPLTLAVGGCATGGGYSLTEAIRRLLTLSSQRAFAVLLQPGGYYDSQVARLALPPRYASATGLVGQILNSGPVRDRLSRTLNGIAERGAERAAPVITNAISTLTVADALSVVRGGERAATDLLSGQIGSGVIEAMFPAVGDALRLAGDNTLSPSHDAGAITVGACTQCAPSLMIGNSVIALCTNDATATGQGRRGRCRARHARAGGQRPQLGGL